MNGKRNYSIDVLKFFAVFMITNSHLSSCYPEGLKRLATGGVSVTLCSSFALDLLFF
jgi:hypothetical protein